MHAAEAIAAGKPSALTIDRLGVPANRNASIGALGKVPGKHLDEYPPTMFKEGAAEPASEPLIQGITCRQVPALAMCVADC